MRPGADLGDETVRRNSSLRSQLAGSLTASVAGCRWVQKLSKEYPTLAFHASLTNSFGKGALINLLRQFSQLHHDRKQLHEVLEMMNDPERLERVAAKEVELFVPAAVLEGGCGFIDLPGNNDADPGCMLQIREGIKEAGAVFVVLKKDLSADKNTCNLLKDGGLLTRVLLPDEPLNLVFLFNRELDQSMTMAAIDTEGEAEARRLLEEGTRMRFKKLLTDVNNLAMKRQEPAR